MNRIEAMQQLGNDLGIAPVPHTIGGIVAMLGGTRKTARVLGAPENIPTKPANGQRFSAEERAERNKLLSPMRTIQRYMKAEGGATGKNVRGQSAEKRSAFTEALRKAVIDDQCAQLRAKHIHGFRVKVKGKFVYSYAQPGRSFIPVTIPRADMDVIAEFILDGRYDLAAGQFDSAFMASYATDGSLDDGRFGEDDADADAFDELTVLPH